jgi:hypothetical protein
MLPIANNRSLVASIVQRFVFVAQSQLCEGML